MAFILFICINGVSAICKFSRLNAVKVVTGRTAFSPQKTTVVPENPIGIETVEVSGVGCSSHV